MTEAIIQTLAPQVPRLAVDNCPDSCPGIWIQPAAWHDLPEHFPNAKRTKLTHCFPRKLVTILTSVRPLSNSLPRTEIWDSFELFSSFLSLPQYSPRRGTSYTSLLHPSCILPVPLSSHFRSNLIYLNVGDPSDSSWKNSEFLGAGIH